MRYTAKIEFDFESELDEVALEGLLQPALVEKDEYDNIKTIRLDNARSKEFAISDYMVLKVHRTGEEI